MIQQDPFYLLKTKEIISILDGDTKYDNYEFADGTSIKIAMPYLSGADLCALSTLFGLPATYSWNGGALSRWQYLDNLLEYCIKNKKCSNLISYMFAKEQFSKILRGHGANEIDEAYKTIVSTLIEKINGILYFGGNELVVMGNNFSIRNIGSKLKLSLQKSKT